LATSCMVGVTPEKAIELVKKGRTGDIVALKYWLNKPDAKVDPKNLGVLIRIPLLTISLARTPSIRVVDGILVCKAFLSEDILPDEVKIEENIVGQVEGLKIYKVSVRIPFDDLVGIFFPLKDID